MNKSFSIFLTCCSLSSPSPPVFVEVVFIECWIICSPVAISVVSAGLEAASRMSWSRVEGVADIPQELGNIHTVPEQCMDYIHPGLLFFVRL